MRERYNSGRGQGNVSFTRNSLQTGISSLAEPVNFMVASKWQTDQEVCASVTEHSHNIIIHTRTHRVNAIPASGINTTIS